MCAQRPLEPLSFGRPSSASTDQTVDMANIDARLAKLQSFLQAARAGSPTAQAPVRA